jgi:hypothetical protein
MFARDCAEHQHLAVGLVCCTACYSSALSLACCTQLHSCAITELIVLRRHCHTLLAHAGYANHNSSSSSSSNTASLQLDARTAAARVTQWLAALLPKLHTQCSTALRSVRTAAALAAVREELWRVTHSFKHLQFDTTTTITSATATADVIAVNGSGSIAAPDSTGGAVWSAACAALVDTAVLDRGLKAAGMQTLLLQRRRSSLGTANASNSSSSSSQQQQPPLDLWSVLFTRYAAVSITTYNNA